MKDTNVSENLIKDLNCLLDMRIIPYDNQKEIEESDEERLVAMQEWIDFGGES